MWQENRATDSGTRAALAVHKQLPEVPLALLDLRDFNRPARSAVDLCVMPSGDDASATENGCLAGISGIGDRLAGLTRVYRFKDDR